MRAPAALLGVIARVSWALAALGIIGLVALSCSIVADVFMRYIFNAPITGVRDMLSLFIAVTIGLMMPVLLMKEGNISVSFIEIVVGRKAGAFFTLMGNIVTVGIFLLISRELYKTARYLGANNETTQVLGVPLEPWWLLVALSFAFSALAALIPITGNIRKLLLPERQNGGSQP